MMQPKERIIRREAIRHALAILFRDGSRTISSQIAPNKIVYVVVKQLHSMLKPKEVARGVLRCVANEIWA